MAGKVSILLLCVALLLTLITANQVSSKGVQASEEQQSNRLLYGVTQGSLKPGECPGRCTDRCSKTSFRKPCMLYCQKCCFACLCVPSGTYGNKQACPCYNNWKTKSGGPKCP